VYIIVNKDEHLSRESIFDFGVSRDLSNRMGERINKHKYDPKKIGMLVIKECRYDNIPSPYIMTPHSHGRVIEHTVGMLRSEFSLRENAKAGDGPLEDPNNQLLAKILFGELRDDVLQSIDNALEKSDYVKPTVSFEMGID
jgi:hypothetical protein